MHVLDSGRMQVDAGRIGGDLRARSKPAILVPPFSSFHSHGLLLWILHGNFSGANGREAPRWGIIKPARGREAACQSRGGERTLCPWMMRGNVNIYPCSIMSIDSPQGRYISVLRLKSALHVSDCAGRGWWGGQSKIPWGYFHGSKGSRRA